MWPILLHIGPLTLHTYGLFVGLGFMAGYGWLFHEFRRRNWPVEIADALFLICLIGGLVGARVLYVLIEFSYYKDHWGEVFKIWSGGLVYYGGLIGAILPAIAYLKRKPFPVVPIADAAAPGLILGQALGRLGCFSAGCCYGLPTSRAWGVVFSDPSSLALLNVKIHPTQLYESFLDLVVFFILAFRNEKRKPSEGSTAALYLCLYGAARFVVEFFRGDDRGGFWIGLSPSQWLSAVGILAGLVWLLAISMGKDAGSQA